MQSERVEEIVSDVRQALRGRQIGYTGLGRLRDGVTVTIRDASDIELAREVLAGLAQPVVANVFGGFNQAVDLDVKAVEEQTFHLLITEEATLARNTSTLQQSIEIIRRRIDELGTTEPTIQRQGATRILVQVPGLDDPQRLKALLGQTAKLNFHLVDQDVGAFEVTNGRRMPPGSRLVYTDTEPAVPYLIKRRAMVSGENLVDASIGFDQQTGAPEVISGLTQSAPRNSVKLHAQMSGVPLPLCWTTRSYPRRSFKRPFWGRRAYNRKFHGSGGQ